MSRLVAPLLLLLLAACGDVCVRANALNQGYRERHAACFDQGTLAGAGLDVKRCQGSLEACSAADLAAIDGYLRCIDALPVCTAATKTSWSEQFLGCTTGMTSLSPGCFVP